jgi:hypothetical protein
MEWNQYQRMEMMKINEASSNASKKIKIRKISKV